jgi:hypothetical protein
MNNYSSVIFILANSANSVTGIIMKLPNITYYIVTDTQFQELLCYLVQNIVYVPSWILHYCKIYVQRI